MRIVIGAGSTSSPAGPEAPDSAGQQVERWRREWRAALERELRPSWLRFEDEPSREPRVAARPAPTRATVTVPAMAPWTRRAPVPSPSSATGGGATLPDETAFEVPVEGGKPRGHLAPSRRMPGGERSAGVGARAGTGAGASESSADTEAQASTDDVGDAGAPPLARPYAVSSGPGLCAPAPSAAPAAEAMEPVHSAQAPGAGRAPQTGQGPAAARAETPAGWTREMSWSPIAQPRAVASASAVVEAVREVARPAGVQPATASAALESRLEQLLEAAGVERALDGVPVERASVPVGRPSRCPTGDAAAPIRCHVEWTSEGARVWLGVDADPALPLKTLLSMLTAELQRWACSAGTRVVQVYCNGRDISAPEPSSGGEEEPSIDRSTSERVSREEQHHLESREVP